MSRNVTHAESVPLWPVEFACLTLHAGAPQRGGRIAPRSREARVRGRVSRAGNARAILGCVGSDGRGRPAPALVAPAMRVDCRGRGLHALAILAYRGLCLHTDAERCASERRIWGGRPCVTLSDLRIPRLRSVDPSTTEIASVPYGPKVPREHANPGLHRERMHASDERFSRIPRRDRRTPTLSTPAG